MSQKLNSRALLAILISVSLIACKGKDKSEETTASTESSAVSTETPTTTTSTNDMDAVKVAPNTYKVLADTMGIRVVETNYKPGESSVMHAHPDLALYVVNPGKAEFTKKDGTKQVMDLTKGMAAIVPADAHSAKNIGTTSFKGILIEVHRAQ